MNTFLTRLTLSALSILCMATLGFGQTEDREAAAAASGNLYVVSAKAGGTSYLEGPVTIKRTAGKSGQLLVGDFVEVGDLVTTGSAGRAEILMNPGSFLRIDKNSEFEFVSTTLDNLTIKVNRGNAIFEVFASDDFKVNVLAGDSTFYLIKSGVYRVDVDARGNSRLEVWRGKALTGDVDSKNVKKGRAAVAAGDSFAVSKFDKTKDDFEEWSEDRAKLIAKSNERLIAKNLSKQVLTSFRDYRWNCFDSIGLWVFNRQMSSFSFLPFGYGWRSPYGYRLRTNTMTCDYPEHYWREPQVFYRPRPVNSGGGIPPTASVPQENVERGRRISEPAYRRMQSSGGVSRVSRSKSSSDFPQGGSTGRTGGDSVDLGRSSTKSEGFPSTPPPSRAPKSSGRVSREIDN